MLRDDIAQMFHPSSALFTFGNLELIQDLCSPSPLISQKKLPTPTTHNHNLRHQKSHHPINRPWDIEGIDCICIAKRWRVCNSVSCCKRFKDWCLRTLMCFFRFVDESFFDFCCCDVEFCLCPRDSFYIDCIFLANSNGFLMIVLKLSFWKGRQH